MLRIRYLGDNCDYTQIWQAMRVYTDSRQSDSDDEIWLLQHMPVFTQGLRQQPQDLVSPHQIPVVASDRGGLVTYHGPGQLLAYCLIDIKRKHISLRQLVSALENAVIGLLADHHLSAYAKADAPGVYIENAKICSLGLRVRQGRSYHGLSLNIAMDLQPFSWINPCGVKNLAVTQLCQFIPDISLTTTALQLVKHLALQFNANYELDRSVIAWEMANHAQV